MTTDKSGGNIIDSVVLTPQMVNEWHQAAKAAVKGLKAPTNIGVEEAYAQDDGCLIICCKVGPKDVWMAVPQGHWSMAN